MDIRIFHFYPDLMSLYGSYANVAVLKRYQIEECWFGHIHGVLAAKKAVMKSYGGFRLHLISADYVNFKPVLVK